jgi:hypothetical protein
MILYQTAKWICSQEMIDIISYHDQVLFRISAHNLEIEMGRYKNKPRDERLCSGCLKVENEVNLLFECNSYLTLRDNFTNSISSIVPN